ncbi:hypothetical protein LCGC14_1999650, partial [marine sediment metagenome]
DYFVDPQGVARRIYESDFDRFGFQRSDVTSLTPADVDRLGFTF